MESNIKETQRRTQLPRIFGLEQDFYFTYIKIDFDIDSKHVQTGLIRFYIFYGDAFSHNHKSRKRLPGNLYFYLKSTYAFYIFCALHERFINFILQ